MVIPKSQAVDNLVRAYTTAIAVILPRIDEKLKDHLAGDFTEISFVELGLDLIISQALHDKIKAKVISEYKAAGWEVDIIQGIGTGIKPRFTFK